MKTNPATLIISLGIIFLSMVLGLAFRPYLPEPMATHWNIQGQPDGFSTIESGVLFMPILAAVLFLFLNFLPQLDPNQKNIAKFDTYYSRFILVIVSFLMYIYLATLVWNVNPQFNFVSLICPAFSVLFYYLSKLFVFTYPNWFVGIRTPWTLSDPVSWQKTHQLGSRLFGLVALISALGTFVPHLALYFILGSVIGSSLVLFIYSYLIFQQNNKV